MDHNDMGKGQEISPKDPTLGTGLPAVKWLIPLLLAANLLFSCGPLFTPTQPTVRPTQATPGPSWTALPASTVTPPATATRTWPTPLPTPTSAPALFPDMQAGTFFFFWHDCPEHKCETDLVYAVPPGWTEPLTGDPDPHDGEYYSSLNRYWYLQEFKDMQLAGIDVVLPVSWGDNPSPWFRTNVLQNLVEANRQLDSPLRIGLFDDTSSEVREYRDYADNHLLDYSTDYGPDGPPLNLQDDRSGFFFYDRKIRPFFEIIPQEMWATHNGRAIEEGGRPLIVVYTANDIIHLEKAGALWSSIKTSFQRDFQDRNGQPITPWLVLDASWFSTEAMEGRPSLGAVVDGRFIWGAAISGLQVRDWYDYTVTSVGPGFDNGHLLWPEPGLVQPRNRNPAGEQGGPGTLLRWALEQIPPRTDLLLVETWNELWEGTCVCRASYPPIGGPPVPEDFFMDLLRRYLLGQPLWWGAQPLPPVWPVRLAAGQSYRLVLSVKNTGTRTWSVQGGEHLLLSGEPFPEGHVVWPERAVRPGEIGQFAIPITTPFDPTSLDLTWQMAGPEGAFGPQADWLLAVGEPPISTTLYWEKSEGLLEAGVPFTLSLGLEPPIPIAGARLRLRFDPAALQMIDVQPLPGQILPSWRVEVTNEQGLAHLVVQSGDAGDAARRLANLRLQMLQAGEAGLWIEQVELVLGDNLVLVLEPQWVSLPVQPAP